MRPDFSNGFRRTFPSASHQSSLPLVKERPYSLGPGSEALYTQKHKDTNIVRFGLSLLELFVFRSAKDQAQLPNQS